MFFIPNFKFLRLLGIISAFIATTIFVFLYLGCISPTSMYSSVYLSKVEFNKTSDLYSRVTAYYNSTNNTGVKDISIQLGYNGACIQLNNNATCYNYAVMDQFVGNYGVPIISSTKTELDIMKISNGVANSFHPKVLLACIIIMVAQLFLLSYTVLPKVPGLKQVSVMITAIWTVMTILFGFSAMLQHQAVTAAKNAAEPASMYLVALTRGTKADAMTWASFSFVVAANVGAAINLVHLLRQTEPPQTTRRHASKV